MSDEIARITADITSLQQAITALANLPDTQAPLLPQLAEKQAALATLRAASTGPTVAGGVRADRDVIIGTNVTVIYQGQRVVVPLREYLQSLSGECNRLALADSASSDPTSSGAIELAAVYTGLEVATLVPRSAEERKRATGRDEQRQKTALEALVEQRRLVLLGDPGGGKSTLVNFVALCVAQARLGGAGWQERLGPATALVELLPVRVILRVFAAWLATVERLPERGLPGLLWRWLKEDQELAEPLLFYLREEIAAGRALVLFDGLDEVAVERLPLVLQSIEALASASGQSRFVVSCRVLDYEEPGRKLADWPSERLIPFADELRSEFIRRWFDVLIHLRRPTLGDPNALRDRLLSQVVQRQELRRLAGNPLLLTMMTRLQASEGSLPGERVRLYERCVTDLLSGWRKVLREREPALGEQLRLPQWSDSMLWQLLARLGYLAHERGISGDGEGGADLPRSVLIEEARRFFARFPPAPATSTSPAIGDYARADIFCSYISKHSNGILQQHSQDVFRFPHRTFQEYLAARRLVADDWTPNLAKFSHRALQAADAGPQWREALLLAVSQEVVVSSKTSDALDLIRALLARHRADIPAGASDRVLAGEVLVEVGRDRLDEWHRDLYEQVIAALVALLQARTPQGNALAPFGERLRAGQVLGTLGDPRYPITHAAWRLALEQRNRDFGKPTGYFCYMPNRAYTIGGWADGETAAQLALSECWIAQLPISVAQYRAFVEANGYATKRWWTPEGWTWRQQRDTSEPYQWNDPQYRQPNQPMSIITWYESVAYCNWLTEQLADNLPAGYAIRLPTEAEWEAAAAWDGTDQRRTYPWGAADVDLDRAVYDQAGVNAPAPIGCCPAGVAACGAIDLAGNVWEWTSSSYKEYPDQAAIEVEAFTPNDWDVPRRGGSYYQDSTNVLCGARNRYYPGGDTVYFGFRIVVAPRLNR